MMDMKSNKRLSQLSDRLSDKKEKKSDIVHVEDIKPVIQDPLFQTIEEEQEINFESVKKGQKADRSAKPNSKITPVLSDRKTTITKVEQKIKSQDASPIKKYVSEATLMQDPKNPFAVAQEVNHE